MRSGVQGLDGFEFVVVKIQNCQIRAGGQICYLCDALKIKWTVFSSYFERDYVTGFIYNLCRKIMLNSWILHILHQLCDSPGSDSGGGWAAGARRRAPPPGTWRMSCWPPPAPAPRPGSWWPGPLSLWAVFCVRPVWLSHSVLRERGRHGLLIKLTGEFINKLQTWHGESIQIKLATTKSGQCVYYLFLYIYFMYRIYSFYHYFQRLLRTICLNLFAPSLLYPGSLSSSAL